jgi:diguanylate cyclase (GGDEF)-like protein
MIVQSDAAPRVGEESDASKPRKATRVQVRCDRSAAMSDGHDQNPSDQTASDRDQTASDEDQTSGDRDQTAADRDQTSSDSDQRSSDDDQEAADADVASGSDRDIYDRTTRAREVATDDRHAMSVRRDEIAGNRETTASDRDHAAALRDATAERRDASARLRDRETDTGSSWHEILLRAARDRERAAIDRERAADDRAQAAADRQIATRERAEALRVRTESDALLEQAATDQLTGARSRFLGLDEASRELERARRRPGASIMLAFVDVDGLKRINDSKGHLAGDGLLRLVVETMRARVRPYDVIVRYGGDEFLCVMSGISAAEAAGRMREVGEHLATVSDTYAISFGLARSRPDDTLYDLIARADADLLDGRSARESA